MAASVGELARPVEVYREHALLSSAIPTLERGQPVVVESSDGRYLLLPKAAVGQQPTRRLDDLPLQPTTAVPFGTSAQEVLTRIEETEQHFVAVERDQQIVGVVSREAIAERVATESREGTEPRDRLVMLGELATSIAHDFNNLLTVTMGRAALLERALPEDSAEHEHVREIADVAARGADLIRQLLAFGGRELVLPLHLDLRGTLLMLQSLLDRLLGDEIDLEVDVPPDLDPIRAAPVQGQRILTNLVVNARHAMPRGGKLSIRARNVTEAGRRLVRLSVEDTGVGIPSDVLPRIFEPYFTTRSDRGSGLGLATVHGTVSQLGGTITVDSTVGEGTRFEILLDVAESADEVPVVPTRALAFEGRARILLVEDDQGIADPLVRVLEMLGHEAHAVASGLEAREWLEASGEPLPDLLITDLVLPHSAGTELVRWVRERYPDLRTILTSGVIDEGPPPSLGDVDAVLPKPYSVDDLSRAIARALDAQGRAAARPDVEA